MFSCAIGREEHCKQISLACVGRARSALGLAPLTACVLSWSTLIRLQVVQGKSKAGPGLCSLPRSKLLRFRFSGTPQRHRLCWTAFCALPRSEELRRPGSWRAHCPRWSVHLNHLPGPSRSVSWVCCKTAISGVPCVSSAKLISGCNPPGRCQPSSIPGNLG